MSRLSLAFLVLVWLPGCSRDPAPERRSVEELSRQLDSRDETLRIQAAVGLGKKGPEARSAAPVLIGALSSSSVLLRQQIIIALGKLGPGNDEVIPALLSLLQDPEWTLRRQAILALGEIQAPLLRVEPALTQAAESDPNATVQRTARQTLQLLGEDGDRSSKKP